MVDTDPTVKRANARVAESRPQKMRTALRLDVAGKPAGQSVEPAPGDRRHSLLTALFDVHRHELISTLRRLFGDGPPEPEDIAQSAFSQIAALSPDYSIQNPKAFLFKVAINFGRRAAKKSWINHKFITDELSSVGPEVEEISPERLLVGKEAIASIDQAFQQLSPKQREIIVRSRLKGETYAEIASETGWSVATISRQLHAAMEVLEAAIDDGEDRD